MHYYDKKLKIKILKLTSYKNGDKVEINISDKTYSHISHCHSENTPFHFKHSTCQINIIMASFTLCETVCTVRRLKCHMVVYAVCHSPY